MNLPAPVSVSVRSSSNATKVCCPKRDGFAVSAKDDIEIRQAVTPASTSNQPNRIAASMNTVAPPFLVEGGGRSGASANLISWAGMVIMFSAAVSLNTVHAQQRNRQEDAAGPSPTRTSQVTQTLRVPSAPGIVQSPEAATLPALPQTGSLHRDDISAAVNTAKANENSPSSCGFQSVVEQLEQRDTMIRAAQASMQSDVTDLVRKLLDLNARIANIEKTAQEHTDELSAKGATHRRFEEQLEHADRRLQQQEKQEAETRTATAEALQRSASLQSQIRSVVIREILLVAGLLVWVALCRKFQTAIRPTARQGGEPKLP